MQWICPLTGRARTWVHVRLAAFALLANLLLAPTAVGYQEPAHGRLPDFDRRLENAPKVEVLVPERAQATARLQEQVKNLAIEHDDLLHAPRFIGSTTHFLTGPDGEGGAVSALTAAGIPKKDPHRAIKGFLQEHATVFGHGEEVLRDARVVRDYVTAHNGLRTVVWEQIHQDIPVFDGVLLGHMTRRGELVNLSSQFIPDAERAAAEVAGGIAPAALVAAPAITDQEAAAIAAQDLGEPVAAAELAPQLAKPIGPEKQQRFKTPRLVGESKARLVWLPIDRRRMRLCWEVELTRRTGGETYLVLVDARSGEVHLRRCRTFYLSDATYRVFTSDSPSPFTPGHAFQSNAQPPFVERMLVTLPALSTNASPLGWVNDGLNETLGNNIDAHLDRDADNLPDLPRPQGNPTRVFDFPLEPSASPATYGDAAVVQLFYWCNWMHDRLYELGFTEASGNFQKDNFGRGGRDNDLVLADAQDGSGVNNANFTPSRDGEPGRIQMYLWDAPHPDRDGDFDAEVILHEYAHGLTDRLVGGHTGIYQLQTYGLAEGWSDFYALALLGEPGDDLGGNYPMGGYVTYLLRGLRENYFFGIRRYPYTTNLLISPLTFADIDPTKASTHPGVPINPTVNNIPANASAVHRQGEVWCNMLWDARANLIARYGYYEGNQLILQLVTDGLKLSPPNPTFTQARDAILQADLVNHGGANQNDLWAAFAKRGMGIGAIAPPNFTTEGVTESYAQPDVLTVLPATSLIFSGPAGGPFSPGCRSMLITNSTPAAQSWAIGASVAWIGIDPSTGSLAPGTGTNVTVCLDPSAAALPVGTSFGAMFITNRTSGRVQLREAQMRVLSFARMPFEESFESSRLGEGWTVTGENTTSAVITTNFGPRNGARHLVLSAATSGVYTRNEVTLGIDLAGFTNVALRFWARSLGEEPDGPPPAPFYDGANFDGVAISTNGVVWFEVQGLRNLSESYTEYEVNLDAAIQAFGLSYTRQFLIRFNEYAKNRAPDDGIAIDDITMTGKAPARFVVSLPPAVREGDGVIDHLATVSLPEPVLSDLAVELKSSNTNQLQIPLVAIIPTGSNSATFALDVVDDARIDGIQKVTVSASAPGFVTGSSTVEVGDNETSLLIVDLPTDATEGDGTIKQAYLISDRFVDEDIAISLSSSDTNEVTVPSQVILPRGQFFVSLPAAVEDDDRIDGPQIATVSAWVDNWTGGTNSIRILDNESTNLVLTVPGLLVEGVTVPPGTATVSLDGTVPTNVTVLLANSDTNAITVPATVTVPPRQISAVLPLDALEDTSSQGARTITLTASAPGFNDAQTSIRVIDNETPPLPFDPWPVDRATNQPVTLALSWRLGLPELLTNGAFETGDFTGWRQQNTGDGDWVINHGTLDPPGPEGPLAPAEGRFSAVSIQNGPGIHAISQDVTVPFFVNSATLVWSHRIRNHGSGFATNQAFRVEIRGMDDGVYHTAFTTERGNPNLGEWSRQTFNLLPFRGQQIRIAFVEEDAFGYLNVHLDDVQVLLGISSSAVSEVFLGTNANLGPNSFVGATNGTVWVLPNLALNTTYFWQVAARIGERRQVGPVWRFSTRGVGPLDHLVWGYVAPTQSVLRPFPVTIMAADDIGNPVTNFTGPVSFSATVQRAVEPVQVLSFTAFADAAGDYRRTLAAISSSFTNYVETTTAITDPVGLGSLLLNQDVFLVVAQDGASPGRMGELGAAWTSTLSNFVWHGGSVIVCSYLRDEHQLLNASGLMSLKKMGQSANAEVGAPTNHVLLEGVTTPLAAQNIARYTASNGVVVLETTATSNAVVIARDFGHGQIVMVGTDFTVNRTGLDRVLANAVRLQQADPTQPLALAPAISGYFQGGFWSGSLTARDIGRHIILRADDTKGHHGESLPFDVEAESDLSITIGDAPDPAWIGDEITYCITVQNRGDQAYTGVRVLDPIPARLEFLRATNDFGSVTTSSNVITCELGSLAGGASATVCIVARPRQGGVIHHTVSVKASEPDAYAANNTATAVSRINFPQLTIGDAFVTEGNSGGPIAVFTVTLSPSTSQTVTCGYATSNTIATAGSDYEATAGLLIFEPGVTNQTLSVRVHSDLAYEGIESYRVHLINSTNALIIDSEGLGVILDDDPVPTLNVADASVVEGNGGALTNAVFRFTLNGLAGASVSVKYATADETAIAVGDYRAKAGTLILEPGVTSAELTVPIIGDDLTESNETFRLQLTQAVNTSLVRPQAIARILDDDEGKLDHFTWSGVEGPFWINTPFTATITARDGLGMPLTRFNGPAQISGLTDRRTVTIGEATNLWEWPMGTYFHDERTQVIYLADEIGGPARISALALDVVATPGQTLSNWTIRLKHTGRAAYTSATWDSKDWTTVYRGHPQILSTGWVNFIFTTPFEFNGLDNLLVDFSFDNNLYTFDGLCRATPTNSIRTLHFRTDSAFDDPKIWTAQHPPPITAQRIPNIRFTTETPVALTPRDVGPFVNGSWSGQVTALEPAARMALRVEDGAGHRGISDEFTMFALDDVSLTVTDLPDPVRIGEPLTYLLAVSNTGPSTATGLLLTNLLSAHAEFVSATASQGQCTASNGTVTCTLGSLQPHQAAAVTIMVIPSGSATLTNLAVVSRAEADGSPANNAAVAYTTVRLPAISVDDLTINEGDDGTNAAVFTVSLSGPSLETVEVDFGTIDLTARADSDYLPTNGTLVFPPGTTSLPVRVPILGDTLSESNETLSVALAKPTGATLGRSPAIGTIVDDDPLPRIDIADTVFVEGDEGTSVGYLEFSLSAPSGRYITVRLSTSNGTATASSDYLPRSNYLVQFPPGLTSRSIGILLYGDRVVEPDETFFAALGSPVNAVLGVDHATLTIKNDDGVAGKLDHFTWHPVPSPQYAGQPFVGTVSAQDVHGNIVTNFAGNVTIEGRIGQLDATIDWGTITWAPPLGTSTRQARSQMIYLPAELEGPRPILGVALNVTTIPGQPLNRWTVRLKHTALTSYGVPAWESEGWTIAHQSSVVITNTGWVTFPFDEPFAYDGTNALLVDFSFNNPYFTTDGLVRATNTPASRAIYLQADGQHGDPLNWSGAVAPKPTASSSLPEIRFVSGRIIPVAPTLSGQFAGGLWSGTIHVLAPATNMVLVASDLLRHVALTPPFTVEPSADTDGDGLPDTWEFAWFGSINSPIGAPGADPDRDSHDNRHEFLAGTGPLDSSSVLRIVDARSDESGVQVRFTSVAGKGYRVERSAQLGGPWNTIIDLVPGTGGVMRVTDSESPQTGQRFYRLRLAP